jgi:uncharacterized protein
VKGETFMAQYVAQRPEIAAERREIATKPVETAGPVAINPAPLGLSAFALTTFVLSAFNAHLFTGVTILIGLALFYGGIAQMLAGMWEFRVGNTFGGVVFSSYGAFWLAVGYSFQNNLIPKDPTAFAYFLLGWTIFTGLMLLGALRTNLALITVFLVVFLTFVALTIAEFGGGSTWGQIGGWLGIIASLLAWYTALAGLLASTKSAFRLPTWPMK